jgi:hypothetical protein
VSRLVGSEMCIRDRNHTMWFLGHEKGDVVFDF